MAFLPPIQQRQSTESSNCFVLCKISNNTHVMLVCVSRSRTDTCWGWRCFEGSQLSCDSGSCQWQFSGEVSSAQCWRTVSYRLKFCCHCQLSHGDSRTESILWSSQSTSCLSRWHRQVSVARCLAWHIRMLGYSQWPLCCYEHSWWCLWTDTWLLYCWVLTSDYTVFQKIGNPLYFLNNFFKCWSIWIKIRPMYSLGNLLSGCGLQLPIL